jgi:predicted metal-dependent enzyme (double-stranded beta helix superfamily)
MSDKDIQFIKDMSSVLNTNTDEDSFIANLKELKKKYSTIAS